MLPIRPFVLLTLASLVFSFPVSPQDGNTPLKEDNLYSMALFASIAEMDKSWGHIDDSNGGHMIRTDYHNMVVEKHSEVTNGLPAQVGAYQVAYLDLGEQIAKCQRVRKAFSILRIHPMRNEGTRLTIQVSNSYLSYERKRLVFALSDWSTVEFSFDCEKQKYVVSAVKLGGI